MSYPGGKNGAGVYQQIINVIPPHDIYIESHLGHGAIMRNKLPADRNVGVDIDSMVISAWRRSLLDTNGDTFRKGNIDVSGVSRGLELYNDNALIWLKNFFAENSDAAASSVFIYHDPPYLKETRLKQCDLYRHEYTEEDHIYLLEAIKSFPCSQAISGYYSELYMSILANWNYITFPAVDRGGNVREEYLWFNYEKPQYIHDYRYLGCDYRERERIKRKKQRWVKRLQKMDDLERNAILSAIGEVFKTQDLE